MTPTPIYLTLVYADASPGAVALTVETGPRSNAGPHHLTVDGLPAAWCVFDPHTPTSEHLEHPEHPEYLRLVIAPPSLALGRYPFRVLLRADASLATVPLATLSLTLLVSPGGTVRVAPGAADRIAPAADLPPHRVVSRALPMIVLAALLLGVLATTHLTSSVAPPSLPASPAPSVTPPPAMTRATPPPLPAVPASVGAPDPLPGTRGPARARATVVPPSIVLNPLALTLRADTLPDASRTIHLVNLGPTLLIVDRLTVTGPNAPDFLARSTCRDRFIVPTDGCTIILAFRPHAPGLRRASLLIADNTADSPHVLSLTARSPPSHVGAHISP